MRSRAATLPECDSPRRAFGPPLTTGMASSRARRAASTVSGNSATGTTARLQTTADLAKYDTALATVATTRSALGAAQNRLESAVNNLTSNSTNLSDARSRIEDADFSTETTALAKAQILNQASTAMLAQANQSQQGVLRLLS